MDKGPVRSARLEVKLTRITFGIIALNAQPFLEYNLRALYPFAHQIIIVEGATRAASSLATETGHSADDTLQILQRFRRDDRQKKVEIICAEDEGYSNGFWSEKDQMSQAYASRATGDWLWQVDSDEFYRDEDMRRVISLVDEKPSISGISFPFYEFWGGFDYVITGKWYLQDFTEVPRLFRWGRGYQYISHRPPSVVDQSGTPLDQKNWVQGGEMRKKGIHMYHYSYVFPKQAKQKVGYYAHVSWTEAFRENQAWLEEGYYGLKRPFFLGERGWPILQWLERFRGEHPLAIQQLRFDLANGKVTEPLRRIDDIEKLLNSRAYRLATRFLRFLMPAYWWIRLRLRFENQQD